MNKIVSISLIIFYLLVLSIYFLLPKSDSRVLLQYFVTLSSLLFGVVSGIYALKQYGLKSVKSKTLLFLTGGITSWFIGEIIWDYLEHFTHEKPFPSLADLFYILGYPLLFVALYIEVKSAKINWNSVRRSLVFLVVIIAILLSAIVGYFGIVLAYSPTEPIFNNIIAISYGVGDLILIVATINILVLAWEYRGGLLSKVWVYMFFSFIFTLIADILFAIYTNSYGQTESLARSITDSIFILSYLFFGYALYNFGNSIESAKVYLQKLVKKK